MDTTTVGAPANQLGRMFVGGYPTVLDIETMQNFPHILLNFPYAVRLYSPHIDIRYGSEGELACCTKRDCTNCDNSGIMR
jgi:hypothetical protein